MSTSRGGPKAAPDTVEPVEVDLPITVGQFVKAAGLASTGGEAKMLVGLGAVRVNGEVETRRGHKLLDQDVVLVAGNAARVVARPPSAGHPSEAPPAAPGR